MNYQTFNHLYQHLQELYQKQEYAKALELVTEQFECFPEDKTLMYYMRTVLTARIGNADQSLSLIEEALQAGCWYSEFLLRKNPALITLQGMDKFERLVLQNRQLRDHDKGIIFPLLILRSQQACETRKAPCPLLLALHGNTSSAQKSINLWQSAAASGWLVAAPQSSQAVWKGAYVWDDYQIAEAEITKHYFSLKERYAIDLEKIALAGLSMGGETAIRLVLTGAIKARGFIAIGPGGPYMDDPKEWMPLIQANSNHDLRGYMILGEGDHSTPQENVHVLMDMLIQGGIPCKVETIPDVGHDFSPEYASSLLRGLDFVIT
jgi:predicted esterase